jgi:hypothetical protein
MRNFHTDSKKFMPGKSTGVYRGRMKHGRGVEHFKDALHTEQRRDPVTVAHEGIASVGAAASSRRNRNSTTATPLSTKHSTMRRRGRASAAMSS